MEMGEIQQLESSILRILRPPLGTLELSGILSDFLLFHDMRSYFSACPLTAEQITTLVGAGIEQVVDAMVKLMAEGRIRDYKLPDGSIVYTRAT